jgi:hypothetical protein
MYRPMSIHTRLPQALHVLGILMPLYPPLFWLGVDHELPPQAPHRLGKG